MMDSMVFHSMSLRFLKTELFRVEGVRERDDFNVWSGKMTGAQLDLVLARAGGVWTGVLCVERMKLVWCVKRPGLNMGNATRWHEDGPPQTCLDREWSELSYFETLDGMLES